MLCASQYKWKLIYKDQVLMKLLGLGILGLTGYLTSLVLSFLIYKMGIILAPI